MNTSWQSIRLDPSPVSDLRRLLRRTARRRLWGREEGAVEGCCTVRPLLTTIRTDCHSCWAAAATLLPKQDKRGRHQLQMEKDPMHFLCEATNMRARGSSRPHGRDELGNGAGIQKPRAPQKMMTSTRCFRLQHSIHAGTSF
jgi:hypothetical protein